MSWDLGVPDPSQALSWGGWPQARNTLIWGVLCSYVYPYHARARGIGIGVSMGGHGCPYLLCYLATKGQNNIVDVVSQYRVPFWALLSLVPLEPLSAPNAPFGTV